MTTTASSSGPSSAAANNAVRTAAQATITSTANGNASSASPVSTAAETMTPLPAYSQYGLGNTPLAVNHQNEFVATTISFNLAPGKSLSDAAAAFQHAAQAIRLPADLTGGFAGAALEYEKSLGQEQFLVAAAVVAIYIVLGILYESFIHPLTILSSLPFACLGGILTLLAFREPLSLYSMVGFLLLIGIVKKNGIMIVDYAIEIQRNQNLTSLEAVQEACLIRFRPIMMTTVAAVMGAIPVAIGIGAGAETRRGLGLVIAGGLLFSQFLTLYITPIIYLYLDRLRSRKKPSVLL